MVAIVLLFVSRFGVKLVVPGFVGFRNAMLGSFACAAAVIVWWVFLSRARWFERLGAIVLMVLALLGTKSVAHESMGPLWLVGYALPFLLLAFVAWAVATRGLDDRLRRVTMVATILFACGVWTLVRTEGVTGDHVGEFAWRWTETTEDRLRALGSETQRGGTAAVSATGTAPSWPGFRGPDRDGSVPGVRIATDWSASPPVELWRRPVGPGWSSFAVHGDLLYTQEQRGDDELVSCYDATTGEPVWHHRDAARFFESNAGAGPRGTPAVAGDRVVALGATGILNALDAASGAVVWSRDVTSDTGAGVPNWGFSSSPLLVDDLVIVAVGGQLVGYELASGEPRWLGAANGLSYSSPKLVTIDGVAQVVQLSATGATGVAPADGTLLWEHPRPGFPIVQPAEIANGEFLISVTQGSGVHRLSVGHGPGGWTVEERWTSTRLKPYFNDFVVHEGHAYGFDGRILAAIDLEDGERKWKGGRYGSGQLILLPDQDLLLVLSEEGELALVGAHPDRFTELARLPALEGKTWNHPVLAGDLLLVRNGREMAAFRLALATG